jgi:hypothetical protein
MTFKEAVNKILSAEQKAELKGLFTFNTPVPVIEPENTPVAEPVAMGEAKLMDGTVVKYDTPELVIGSMITVVTPDGEFPAPVGEHTLENGTVITVDETGKVIEIEAKEQTPEVVVEPIAPVAMAVTPEEKQAIMDEVIAMFEPRIKALEDAILVSQSASSELQNKFSEFGKLLDLPTNEPTKVVENKFQSKLNKIKQFNK